MGTTRTVSAKLIGLPLEHILRADRREQRRIYRDRRKSMYGSRETIEKRRMGKLRRLLTRAGEHVPYYRELFHREGFDPAAVRDLNDLQALPPLEKATMQERLEDLVDERADPSSLIRKMTGGSTGRPTVFYNDHNFSVHEQGLTTLAFDLFGRSAGGPVAYIWGAPFDIPGRRSVKERALAYLRNLEYLAGYTLRRDDLPATHAFLQRFRPEVILGYTNLLVAFARFLLGEGIEPRYPKRSVVCSAETLVEPDREVLRRVFGKPVFNSYGARDVGLMALECSRAEGLHVMAEDVILEPWGEATPDTGDVQLLVTKLNSLAMPLIRLKIGDRVVFGERSCPCGIAYPLLERVVGRSSAIVRLPDGGYVSAILFPMLLKEVGVTAFQVVQRADLSLRLLLPPGELDAEGEEMVRRVIADRCPGLPLALERADLSERTGRTGKLEPFVSEVKSGP